MENLKRNAEHYPDPTAYKALRNLIGVKFSFMPLVYVCSPYAGDVDENLERQKDTAGMFWIRGFIPITPHLFLPQFMDDKTERNLAIFIDLVLLSKCAEVWVFGEQISEGMEIEISYANRKGKIVRYIKEVQ